MQGLSELRQLKTLFTKKRGLNTRLQQETKAFNNKKQSFYKPVIPQKKLWRFNSIKACVKPVLAVSGIYALAYSIIFIFAVVGAVLLVPLTLIGIKPTFLDAIVYYTGYPATWFGGLFSAWMRNMSYTSRDISGGHFGYVLIGTLIFIAAALVFLLTLDLIITLIKNPAGAAANANVHRKNQANQKAGDMECNGWMKTEDYRSRMQRIRETESALSAVNRDIRGNNALHSDYKDEGTVDLLVRYLETGRANSIMSAINLMHSAEHEQYMESNARERLAEEKRARAASEKSAEYQRKNFEETRWQGEQQRRHNNRQETLAAVQIGMTYGVARAVDNLNRQ